MIEATGKAPRSGESLPTVKATGLARGILPLAVWLDGDRSHGQAGNSIKPDGKAGIGQGFTVCQHTATKKARATGASLHGLAGLAD